MPPLIHRLAPGVTMEGPDRTLRFSSPGDAVVPITPPDEIRELVLELATGFTEARIAELDATAAARYLYIADQLEPLGLIEYVWQSGGQDQIVFSPNGRCGAELSPAPPGARLSRYVYMQPGAEGWIVRTADKHWDARIASQDVFELMHMLTYAEAGDGTVSELREVMWRFRFMEAGEPEDLADECWEFHDMLFHHASRIGNDRRTRGGTYRFRGRYAAPPARAEGGSWPLIPMPPPAEDPPGSLQHVLTHRRSIRVHDDAQPITSTSISAFLWRALRYTGTRDAAPDLPLRVFPSAGSLHELEFYLAVRRCHGLPSGVYHYNAWDHVLEKLNDAGVAHGFTTDAARSWGAPDAPPQIVVIVASRMPRLAWKYEGFAYRLTLLDSGVALQTMCLVAADMDLAGTILGAGNIERFGQATGKNPREETSVAEFALGSKPGEATM